MSKGRRFQKWYERKRRTVEEWDVRAPSFLQFPFSTEYIKGDVAGEFTFFEYLKGDTALAGSLTVYIKGDAALQFQFDFYIRGDVEFAASTVYIKGDTSLVSQLTRYIKGDAVFAFNAVYIKGQPVLVVTAPLVDLGEDPLSTQPGSISRIFLSVEAVKKDVT